ncbi:MAG: hypothetical protein OHK0022_60120 [Roseiflexaceae bacterium]
MPQQTKPSPDSRAVRSNRLENETSRTLASQALPNQIVRQLAIHSPADIQALQRSIGNRAVGQLLQARGYHPGIQPTPLEATTSRQIRRILDPVAYPTKYKGDLLRHKNAVDQVTNELNQRVDTAYQQSLQWQTLSQSKDPMVRQWYKTAEAFAQNPDREPRIIHARFGYSIESIACQGLDNTQMNGLTIRIQVAHGHTRPDIVLMADNQEIAWLDITSRGSEGHIRGKSGAGWTSRPFVRELVYPQLQLRNLLNATNDPFYQELGLLIANERQVELAVKEGNRTKLRNLFLKLAEDKGWETGTGDAAKKRQITRDFFIREAASEGVEEETASMKNTRGALEDLGINPGPYGFNRGNVKSSNIRVNQMIDAMSEKDIAIGKRQLNAGTTSRILYKLTDTALPTKLLDKATEEFWVEPGARSTTLMVMALKGVVRDLAGLENLLNHIRAFLTPSDKRAKQLEGMVKQQLAGPQEADLKTILTWRDQTKSLGQRTVGLLRATRAAKALHQYTVQQHINFFNRPPEINNWFQRLAQDPPDMQAVEQVTQWLRQKAQQPPQPQAQNSGKL